MKLAWICLVAALFLAVPAHGAEWELVTRDGREYVTLKSFCEFYRFPYNGMPQDNTIRLRNAQHSVTLHLDSRDASIDGVRQWLSFGVRGDKNDWLISRLDLVKLFEPLLRPHLIAPKKPVLGVVIDPGHGGSDNGALSQRGVMEKNITLDTALRLEKALRAAGFKTVMTRRSDVFIDLYERAQRPSAFNGYIFVSMHYNSAGKEARGLETYACSPRGAGSTQAGGSVSRGDFQKVPGNENDSLNILLADEVHKQIITLNPGDPEADRGVKRARFVVLRQNTVPAILVEGGFLSHRMESSALSTAAYRQKLADAVARGVINYAAIMSPPAQRITPPPVRPVETPKPAPKPATPPVPVTPPVPPTPAPVTPPVQPVAPAPTPARPATEDNESLKPSSSAPPETSTPSTPEAPSAPTEVGSEKPTQPTVSTNAPPLTEPATEKPAEKPDERPGPTEPEPSTTIYPDRVSTDRSELDQP